MNSPTHSTRRSPSLAGRNPAYWLLCLFGVLVALLVFATPATGQDDSPQLRAAIALIEAEQYQEALPGLIAASAAGERIANFYIGAMLLNGQLLDQEELQRWARQDLRLRSDAELRMLREIVDLLGKLYTSEAIPEFKRRVEADNTEAMVDLALTYTVLEPDSEFLNPKTLPLLERAAEAGNERAVTLLWANYTKACLVPGGLPCNADKVQQYGCTLVRKGHSGATKLMARRFPDRPCN